MAAGRVRRTAIAPASFADENETFWTESDGWHAVVRQLDEVVARPEASDEFRTRCNRLLRGDVPLDPENLEQILLLQYDLQVRLLCSLSLVKEADGQRFITAIDGNKYPLPSFEEVLERVEAPGVEKKVRQGFDTLLHVPFGIPRDEFFKAWSVEVQKNPLAGYRVEMTEDEIDGHEPMHIRYEPKSYDPVEGLSKKEIVRRDKRGWDVLLVEGVTEIPRQGEGKMVGGRRQVECGRSAAWYLRNLPKDEIGWTPETYIVRSLDALRRSGTPIGRETEYVLAGSSIVDNLPNMVVPTMVYDGEWYILGEDPYRRDDDSGAPSAARVI